MPPGKPLPCPTSRTRWTDGQNGLRWELDRNGFARFYTLCPCCGQELRMVIGNIGNGINGLMYPPHTASGVDVTTSEPS